jgi:hypothetical protein
LQGGEKPEAMFRFSSDGLLEVEIKKAVRVR